MSSSSSKKKPKKSNPPWKGEFSYDHKTWHDCKFELKTKVFVDALKHFETSKDDKAHKGKPWNSLGLGVGLGIGKHSKGEYAFKYTHIFPIYIDFKSAEFAYVSEEGFYGFFKLSKDFTDSENNDAENARPGYVPKKTRRNSFSGTSSSNGSPKALSPKGSPKGVKAAAQKWAAMYNNGYEPPAWSLERVGTADWNRRAKLCRVYAPKSTDPTALAAVVSEREPVNIGMYRPYTPTTESGYERLYKETKTLPPNFALYMPSVISSKARQLVNEDVYHIINSIGYAFDAVNQVDYKYFMESFTDKKKKELQDCLADTLNLAFQCAADIGKRKICLCYLGGVSFATKFKPNPFSYKNLFFAALKDVLTPKNLAAVDEINLLGYDPYDNLIASVGKIFKELVEEKGKTCQLLGRIPNILTTDTLFMNAWDPHSVVGNGNEGDNSLDGYFGRLSDMGYMSIPEINRHLLENVRYV